MAHIKAHELAYTIERVLEKNFKRLKVPRSKSVAEEITPEIMDDIPSEAYEPQSAWSDGQLFFHGRVGKRAIREIQYDLTETHLNVADKSKPITLFLSSLGGECYAGLALIGTIQHIRAQGRPVNCHIMGAAMSMGSLIAQACDRRTMDEAAWFMLHEVAYETFSQKVSAHLDEIEATKALQNALYGLYSKRTGKPVEWYTKRLHKTDWYMSAAEALDEGLIDEIIAAPPYPKYRRKKNG